MVDRRNFPTSTGPKKRQIVTPSRETQTVAPLPTDLGLRISRTGIFEVVSELSYDSEQMDTEIAADDRLVFRH